MCLLKPSICYEIGTYKEIALSGYFMNFCRETAKMGVPPGNRRALVPRRT